MEFPLILNQAIRLGPEKPFRFPDTVTGKGTVYTTGRKTASYKIPPSPQLVQDLRLNDIPCKLRTYKELVGPTVTVAFKFVDIVEEGQDEVNGFLSIPEQGFIRIENLEKLTSSIVETKGLDVKIRLDIENVALIHDNEEMYMNPRPNSSKHIFPVTGNGPQNRRLDMGSGTEATEVAMLFEGYWTSYRWEITVSLTLICSSIGGLDPEIPFHLAYAKKLLANTEDLTIIAENGSEIKAHRTVLAAHSSVFGAMFQHNMVEARTGVLQLKEMSEESVRAFIEFLYTRKLPSADDNPLVYVDLLEAGHKYDIQPMENFMKSILLEEADDWYTPEAVLRLIIFVRGTKLEKLQKRANQLLYMMKREVKSLATFRELCEEYGMTETELFSYFAVPVSKFENNMLVKVTSCHSK